MSNKIIINASALNGSGALSILNQFIDSIPNDEYEYILFINDKIDTGSKKLNLEYIPIDVKSLRKRFLWDAYGLKKWLKRNGILPLATISMQNTNFRTNKSIPNFIYYHQSIPFYKQRWNVFSSKERILWFYKNIYPFFVKLFLNKKTEIFVQLNFIKEEFADRFNFPKHKIHVVSPKIYLPERTGVDKIKLDKMKLNLFYPATPFFYKNHNLLLNSILLLDDEIKKNTTLFLTCEKKDLDNIFCEEFKCIDIVFVGQIPFSKVLGLYESSDALLFPSYIETFGLPLIEAASFGVPIIAVDLPYAREVLEGYSGVKYVNYKDSVEWSKQIAILYKNKGQRFSPYILTNKNSWPELFNIIKNKIKENVQK